LKKTFVIILTLIGFVTFGQENKLDRINNEVNLINSDSTLIESEFDWAELTGITTDGGGILKMWQNQNQICKIVEEIGLSYGRVSTVIYLESDTPIKIIETEENFGNKDGEINYNELNEVFRANIYIFDWENDDGKIERIGKRVLSEGSCSTFDYETIIARAKKAIEQNSKAKRNLLLGKWFFNQAIDAKGIEVKLTDLNGQYEIGIIASDIEFFNNQSYQKILPIDPENIQTGRWELIEDEEVKFTFLNEQNAEESIHIKILRLNTAEMIIKQDEKIYHVYKRNRE
jgi:hypothetical protein